MTAPRDEADACVSDLTLDQWIANELDAARRSEVAAHLDACVRCRGRLETIEAETQAFLSQAPTFAEHARVVEELQAAQAVTVRNRRLAVTSSLLAVAAMVGLAVVTRDAPHTVRSKGDGPHVSFFVKREGHVTEGVRGQSVRAGDQLRFTYTSATEVHAMLIDVDERGPTVYLPNAGERSVRLPPGQARALDFGVELDDATGREHVYAVFCPHPFDVNEALSALSAPQPAPPKGCTLDVIELHKEPR